MTDHGPCIEWTGYRFSTGYGAFKRQGRYYRVTRVVWEGAHGPIPEGMLVCHRCDNPPCYRMSHLFLGTASDNQQDCVRKGRHYQKSKTHCPRGHELIAENCVPGRWRLGERRCKICAYQSIRDCNARKKARLSGLVA